MKYKALIPSAGLGIRLGVKTKNTNKALVSIANKPVISYIIEKFPLDIEIVIAIGHKGNLIKQYIKLAYPDRKITFVDINPYQGPGSGLGYTILQCKNHLQCPFVFCTNDTIVSNDIPIPQTNWMGYSDVKDNSKYRSITFHNKVITGIFDKESKSDSFAYIGLSGIRDYEYFWDSMEKGVSNGSISMGETFGLKKLFDSDHKVTAENFDWFDTGTPDGISKSNDFFLGPDSPNILPKPNEDIWFVNNKVIKYSEDKNFIKNRVIRAQELNEPKFLPKIIDYTENMYSYEMVSGKVFSKCVNTPLFKKLLSFLVRFWGGLHEPHDPIYFNDLCKKFYKKKTYERVQKYFDRFQKSDEKSIINGVEIPKIYEMLDSLDWEHLCDGRPHKFHGDLHFENILVTDNGGFLLLDWRQDFGGNISPYGDIYYDLAKLLHGIIVSHDIINKENYSVVEDLDVIEFDFLRSYNSVKCEKTLNDFVISQGLNEKKVKILTALVFINCAPLHHQPYSNLLFYLGKYELYNQAFHRANEPKYS